MHPGDTVTAYPANYARAPRFKALLYYSDTAESAHVKFAQQAIEFFHRLTYGEGYILDKTTTLSDYDFERLKDYNLIIAINTSPTNERERRAFEKYMEHGGGWMGFHAAGYNDRNTKWEWFNQFLGAGKFYCNNWPPQPVLVDVELSEHPVTKNLPRSFVAPECEWYQWNPTPRLNTDVEILLSLSLKNYPLGIKDVVNSGDFPIVWTNTKYRMIYLNIGHGDREFTDATQNLLMVNAFRWIASTNPAGDPFINPSKSSR
ncbi:MAG: ThuA domain-containing protein [Bacteroides sp.]|nr:ThuA domain-containing protein [Bacteroides sp.]MCM1389714.1 ThuA domain-containing protein [Bacteroides sp.]